MESCSNSTLNNSAEVEKNIAGLGHRMSVLLRFLVDAACPPRNLFGLRRG